jgi:hypothetical protein
MRLKEGRKKGNIHTHIEPLRKGNSNIGRFKLKEGEIERLKEKGR